MRVYCVYSLWQVNLASQVWVKMAKTVPEANLVPPASQAPQAPVDPPAPLASATPPPVSGDPSPFT